MSFFRGPKRADKAYVNLFRHHGSTPRGKHIHSLKQTASVLANLERFLRAISNLDDNEERRKSFSTNEKIQSFEPHDDNQRLEEHMKLSQLQELMVRFLNHRPVTNHTTKTGLLLPNRRTKKRKPGCLSLNEFKETISHVLDSHDYDDYLEKLFNKVDTKCMGYVDWDDFCSYMLVLYRENDYVRSKYEVPFLLEPKIRHIVNNREGAMTVWDSHLRVEKTFMISEDGTYPHAPKRRFRMWVTDMIYMPNANKLAVASTSRDIHFYDITSSQYIEETHLFAMADVPYCFDYWYDKKNGHHESLLIFGTDTGSINLFYFHKPMVQLFNNPFKTRTKVQKIFFQDLKCHSEWLTHTVIAGVHPAYIRRVRFVSASTCIISASDSPRVSLVISDVNNLRRTYVFRQEKGVECFDYIKSKNLLATGSADHLVRLWNAYVTSKPVAILSGHSNVVVDILIHEDLEQVISYSKDAILRVWDMREYACLQTVVMKFPNTIDGRIPEQGHFPLYLQLQPTPCLLVTCNDYLGQLKLGQLNHHRDTTTTTHNSQLCAAIYNSHFKQVVTGCDISTVTIWDVETGSKSIILSNAHGDEEITAMALDSSRRHLITGARNGSIKVWNFQNGHNVHRMEVIGDAEVTGLVHLLDKKMFLAVGWNRLIVQYDSSKLDDLYIEACPSWKGGKLHHEDILAMDVCLPNLLATASYDGELLVWTLDTEQMFLRLRPRKMSSRSTSVGSRPNSRHRSFYKFKKGEATPVDKLLFLRARASYKQFEGAILVSSEAGSLRWWSIFGPTKDLGVFYVPDSEDECVLAVCTKPDNSLLITGDTKGILKVWNIQYYATTSNFQHASYPEMLHMWPAHDSVIVSVEYIDHEYGQFLLTASTDHTARLWTLDGQFIGTFGQKQCWNLKQPNTWAHPCTPWNLIDFQNETVTLDSVMIEGLSPLLEEDTSDVTIKEITTVNQEDMKDQNRDGNDRTIYAVTGPSPNSNSGQFDIVQRRASLYNSSSLPDNIRLNVRSHTFAHQSCIDASKTFLGPRVSAHLLRKQVDRRDRRFQFNDVRSKTASSRLGTRFAPFHSLITPDMNDESFPSDLPMSQRMISRGYTSHNLTQTYLRNMNLSLFPDTPPDTTLRRTKTSLDGPSLAKLPQLQHPRPSLLTST